MPIKLKKTNIQNDLETPDEGWVFLGVDENGVLVKKDDDGTYEKIVKDDTYGIYLRVESDYFTLGNRLADSSEGLYSFGQGDIVTSSGFISSTQGKYAISTGDYSFSRGMYVTASGKYSYISGRGFNTTYPLVSSGENSFVHSYALTGTDNYGTSANYSAILGGCNNKILSGANNSAIIGGYNNIINQNITNSVILGGHDTTAVMSDTLYTTLLHVKTGADIYGYFNCQDLNSDYFYSLSGVIENDLKIFGDLNVRQNISTISLTTENIIVHSEDTPGYVKTNGTIDTNTFLCDTGGSMFGDLILSGTTIKSLSTSDNTNVLIGAHNFINAASGNALHYNVVIGDQNAAHFITGSNNIVIGSYNANVDSHSSVIGTMNKNILIGYQVSLLNDTETNEIVIGNEIKGKGSNTVSIGNTNTVGIYLITNADNGNIYQRTASILTSDARLKSNVRKLTDNEINAAKELSKEIGIYTFLKTTETNYCGEKLHIGMTVQRAIEIMKDNNLDPFAYSFICKDENYDDIYKKYLDDNIIYGFRYTELLLFISCGLEQRITELEK